MLITYPLLLTVFILSLTRWLWNRRSYYSMQRKIGGPTGLPFLGIALNFLNRKDIINYLEEATKKYGKMWFCFVGPHPYLILTDPIIIEEVYNSDKFLQKLDNYNIVKATLGDGLFTSANEKWSHNRKLINKTLTHKILISFFPIFNDQGRFIVNNIIKKYVGKGECDILDELLDCTTHTTMKTTMGKGNDNVIDPETDRFVKLFHTCHHIIAERIFNPFFNFIFPIHPQKKILEKSRHEALEYIISIINERFNILSEKKNKDPVINDDEEETKNIEEYNITKPQNIFIDQIYEFYKNGDLAWEDVISEVPTMIGAAFETTAYTLNTCLLLLAMNPKYQDILYKEIMLAFPEDDIEITYEHLRQISYSEMVINETMRVIATVPLVGRKASMDIKLKNNLFIAKGTNVVLNIFNLHRDKEIWGENSTQFNPDNFLKENISKKHPYSFVPFTKGLRNCIGWRYGMFTLQISLIHILKKYKITTKCKMEDLHYIIFVVMLYDKKHGLEFELRNK